MKRWITALFLGVATMMGLTLPSNGTAAEPTSEQAMAGWCYYGSYYCYETACSKARYLRSCGYSTKIVDRGDCYAVYYYH